MKRRIGQAIRKVTGTAQRVKTGIRKPIGGG